MLDLEADPLLSFNHFLMDCQRLLLPNDFNIVQKATLIDKDFQEEINNDVLDSWRQFNRQLRNEIAWFRASEMGKEPLDYIRGDRYAESFLVDIVAQAAESSDPLIAERLLDDLRWQYLDDLVRGHYFDLEFLLIYALKLQILERYQIIKSSQGEEIFADCKKLDSVVFQKVQN